MQLTNSSYPQGFCSRGCRILIWFEWTCSPAVWMYVSNWLYSKESRLAARMTRAGFSFATCWLSCPRALPRAYSLEVRPWAKSLWSWLSAWVWRHSYGVLSVWDDCAWATNLGLSTQEYFRDDSPRLCAWGHRSISVVTLHGDLPAYLLL